MSYDESYVPSLRDLFLSSEFPVNEVGLFLGCGASKEAGYPLTWELTRDVLQQLGVEELRLLKAVLDEEKLVLDIENGFPDIEIINDILLKRNIRNPEPSVGSLELGIREKILNNILAVQNPDLTNHKRLLRIIKKRSHGITSNFWILSTNYDLLLEEAASFEQISLENGFSGATLRYFDVETLKLQKGTAGGTYFIGRKECTLRLVKLHGSISWFSDGGKVFEGKSDNKVQSVILPCRTKIIETLQTPFDSLFYCANQILGANCKFILSIGHSFRDEHINKNLLIPKLKEGKIKIMALMKDLSAEAEDLASIPSFNYITETSAKVDGRFFKANSQLWKFSSFVQFVETNFPK